MMSAVPLVQGRTSLGTLLVKKPTNKIFKPLENQQDQQEIADASPLNEA